MNEQLEYLRLLILEAEESMKERKKLFEVHYPKLRVLGDAVRNIHPSETRRTILLSRFEAAYAGATGHRLMPVVDVLCEIYQKTNNNAVRRLIDGYEGGWQS